MARLLLVVCVVVTKVTVVGAQAPEPTKLDARAQFQPCTTCHGRPDPRIQSDKLWIGRVAQTACVQPLGVKSEPLRKALREYLLSESDLARREDRVREVAAGEGRIVLAHPESISLLLVPEADGDPVRVVWKSEQGKEVRTIAAGTYRVQHYAMTRRDRQDVEWQLWASGSKGRIVKIEEGADPLTLRLDPRIHLRTTARWADRGLRVGIAPTGDRGMGVTIMRDGKRIPAKYRVLGSEGITAKGAMAYG